MRKDLCLEGTNRTRVLARKKVAPRILDGEAPVRLEDGLFDPHHGLIGPLLQAKDADAAIPSAGKPQVLRVEASRWCQIVCNTAFDWRAAPLPTFWEGTNLERSKAIRETLVASFFPAHESNVEHHDCCGGRSDVIKDVEHADKRWHVAASRFHASA